MSLNEAANVILYDLKGVKTPEKPWNPNTFKTRLLLNAKKISFETTWVTYITMPEILTAAGFEGNKSAKPSHTVPTICIVDGDKKEFVADSEKIAPRIEELFPDRGLKVDLTTDLYKEVNGLANDLFGQLVFVIVYNVRLVHIANQSDSCEYFRKTREARFNKKFDDMPAQHEASWQSAAPTIEKLSNMLLEKPGPFFEGSTPGYADVRVASVMWYMHVTGLLDRFLSYDEHGTLTKLWKSTAEWRQQS